jgi:hypothetical protein
MDTVSWINIAAPWIPWIRHGNSQQVMPSYKLTYFDIRGLAENARILFAAAKQPYEDVRLSLSFGTPGDFSTIQRGLVRLKGWGTCHVAHGTWQRFQYTLW